MRTRINLFTFGLCIIYDQVHKNILSTNYEYILRNVLFVHFVVHEFNGFEMRAVFYHDQS